MIATLRWALGAALLALFALVCVLNAGVFWRRHIRKRNAPSLLPLLGGVSGSIGLCLLPVLAVHPWWWLPLLLDWGCVPGIVFSIAYYLVVGRNRQSVA